MNDLGFGNSISVRLDPEILRALIYGEDGKGKSDDDAQQTALRELQVYRLLRHLVTEMNGKLKGRRERFKLVDEGEGLVIEFVS